MLDEEAARRKVEGVMAGWPKTPDKDDEVVVWDVEEHSRAWILHYATRRWLRTRSFSDQLVGSCPIVVDKRSGNVHLYGSAPAEYDKFCAWLDPVPE
ncbi:YrhB domain-containing protein [Arthrobacter sp. NEB 688]|uniref:YrhB domain-containing protein n=1 Tax=Arthrobacter sp. NEB 688 TaxID=904039 RepID=UPI0015668818|nr:hypothetical protein HL663_15165 [Arthrobacter sp. NEB 688]